MYKGGMTYGGMLLIPSFMGIHSLLELLLGERSVYCYGAKKFVSAN
jgi:hypothetical protein